MALILPSSRTATSVFKLLSIDALKSKFILLFSLFLKTLSVKSFTEGGSADCDVIFGDIRKVDIPCNGMLRVLVTILSKSFRN